MSTAAAIGVAWEDASPTSPTTVHHAKAAEVDATNEVTTRADAMTAITSERPGERGTFAATRILRKSQLAEHDLFARRKRTSQKNT